MPPPPAWLHKNISREKTEELITKAGLDDGRFLLRTREGKDDYVLCVVFKSKPTHHLVSKNEEGQYTVNKKTFGGHTKLADLVGKLGTKQPGWPVPLSMPVNRAGAGGVGGGTDSSSWLAGPISRDEAEAAVADGGKKDGNYVVRTRPGKANEYVLCVVYKGKPTHHLIAPNDQQQLCVNKKPFGGHSSIESLIGQLQTKTDGWPLPLSGPKNPSKVAAPAPVEPAPAPIREPAPKAAPVVAVAAVKAAPPSPVKTLEPSSTTSSSTTDDDMTIQLARAVLTLDTKVSAAEGKLAELQALLQRLESA